MDSTVEVARELAPKDVLRAAINLGNPVLTHGTPENPGGVTVAIAHALATRLDLPVQFICVDAARKSFAALAAGEADVTFLAIEPAREGEVNFSPPYLTIEGVYATPRDADFRGSTDVDRPGVRIGVKEGSAYDLYLTRTIQHAELVRGVDGTDVFVAEKLDVAAGIRQPVSAFVAARSDLRLLEPAFMQIHQAVGIPRIRSNTAASFVSEFVQELLASGFIRSELHRAGQDPDLANDRN